MKKQKTLFEKYGELLKLLNIEEMVSTKKTNEIIKESLGSFCRKHKNPAIWCYGEHTRMMMADFIYEMKNAAWKSWAVSQRIQRPWPLKILF